MIRPALDEAKKFSCGCTVVPIALEILSDQKTPIEILRNVRRQSDCWYILESVNGGDSWGRYSFLGYKPVMAVFGTGNSVTIKNGTSETKKDDNAIGVIREIIAQYKSPRIPYLPPFTGGFVGYFAYDFVQHFITGLTLNATGGEGFPDCYLMLMDKVIVFDHFRQKVFIIINIATNDIENSYSRGVNELNSFTPLL